jgi:two-component system, NarL family, nitrate/nitrite response regulator NarL
MRLPLQVGIASTSPIFAAALQHLLESGPESFQCQIVTHPASVVLPSTCQPDVLLIALQSWEEAMTWLVSLQRKFPGQPRLLLADLCLVGISLSFLERQRFTIVSPTWSAEELRISLRLLAAGYTLCSPAKLLEGFVRGLPCPPRAPAALHPTRREFECACAASLGLSNQQIGGILHLEESTVKEHLHHLFQKLRVSNRRDLGIAIRRALSSLSPAF